MKIDSKDFRVRPEEKVKLRKWPTVVEPFCKSKKAYRQLLEEHVEALSSLQRLFYASNRRPGLQGDLGLPSAGTQDSLESTTSATSVRFPCNELEIRHRWSAFFSSLRALSASNPGGTLRLAKVVYPVNCVTPSTRSNTPSTRHSSSLHSSLEARAIARKLSTKQSASDAQSSVSGDHTSPGPSNSGGGAVAISGKLAEVRATVPSGRPFAAAV